MAKQHVWEVDQATKVEASFGWFGKVKASVNGVAGGKKLSSKETALQLPDGRTATLKVAKSFVGHPGVDLLVDGHAVVATPEGGLHCPACKHTVHGYDRFCDACGKPLPTAQDYLHKNQVNAATTTIKVLGWMYLVFGIVMYFVTRNQVAPVLEKLATMAPGDKLPEPINGVVYTVAELRASIEWEVWSVLLTNLVLAASMALLTLWSRRAPLAAVLVAAAVYAAVNVLNAIIDPATIGQGVILKIIIVAYLARGIRSALALRSANG